MLSETAGVVKKRGPCKQNTPRNVKRDSRRRENTAIEYKIGPNKEPCGTPQASLCLDKQSFATLTYWNRFER